MKKLLIILLTLFAFVLDIDAQGTQLRKQIHTNLLARQTKIKDLIIFDERIKSKFYIEQNANEEEDDYWDNEELNPYTGVFKYGQVVDLRDYVNPVKTNVITSHFGWRQRFGRNHYGIDLAASVGDTIYAAFDGKVRLEKFNRGGYGFYVVIRHNNGIETLYAHLSRFLVKENATVKCGQPIALSGNTGRSTGPHLHFEMRYMGKAMDPEKLVNFETHCPLVANINIHENLFAANKIYHNSSYKKHTRTKTTHSKSSKRRASRRV